MNVSIVIPTFNRPHFLDRLLSSIKKQTYQQFEVIIVDDASNDQGQYHTVIEKHRNDFQNFSFFRNRQNSGAPETRNRGIRYASGELIALVDDDDEWLEQKLEMQVERFQAGPPELGLVYTWALAMQNHEVIHQYQSTLHGSPLKELLLDCFIPSPSVMVKRSAILNAGGFDPRMPSCQDWDMWIRILQNGYTIDVVQSFQTIYHKHSEISIGTSPKASEGYRMFYQKHAPLYWKYHKSLYLKRKIKQILTNIVRKTGGGCKNA